MYVCVYQLHVHTLLSDCSYRSICIFVSQMDYRCDRLTRVHIYVSLLYSDVSMYMRHMERNCFTFVYRALSKLSELEKKQTRCNIFLFYFFFLFYSYSLIDQ